MVFYYLCRENKGASQLRGNRAADLCLIFANTKSGFSYHAAQSDLSLLHRCMFSASLMMSILILPNVSRDDYQIISCMIVCD